MRKTLILCIYCISCIGGADAAVRNENSINRLGSPVITTARTVTQPQLITPGPEPQVASRTNQATVTSPRDTSIKRATTQTRNAVTRTPAKNTAGKSTTTRSATTQTTARSATTSTPGAITSRGASVARSAATARSATSAPAQSNTFGTGYNTCRDAYFTCMDQFCAKKDEKYRRCACSSRLEEIQGKERALSQTSQQLQDFKDLNIDAISKTGAEVKAMVNASEGELTAARTKDKSDSAQQLAGISAVLNKTKSQSLSTQGKLDIAGDINAIWATTDMTAGADIMNLNGEKLYNAIHSQCVTFVEEMCESKSTLNMVVSAYGMYIENDCTTLSNELLKNTNNASASIRSTEREMNVARLENYDAHNSTTINDCIAQVRKDITADTACGKNYIHCLDITGKYLYRDTGEPIYSANFYQLETMTSLSGDTLTNQTNRILIVELERKKEFAKRGLDTCRDLADEVWQEFLRQSVAEIYQGQQSRIRQVKNECIDVVNQCYDAQSKSLKDFSNIKEQLLLGARMELSEQMCQEKLEACSNLYGGGTGGLNELLRTMQNITDQKIAKDCKVTLEEYVMQICDVPSSDTLHTYPFACRTYAPGEQIYATIPSCNRVFVANNDSGNIEEEGPGATHVFLGPGYNCPAVMKYINCEPNHYMTYQGITDATPKWGNRCSPCPARFKCAGGLTPPIYDSTMESGSECGQDYVGSLYQKLVRYAMQTCIRPSKSNEAIPIGVLEDVNSVMDQIKIEMGKELAKECSRLGGTWVNSPFIDQFDNITKLPPSDLKDDNTGTILSEIFYKETSSYTKWGHCAETPTTFSP